MKYYSYNYNYDLYPLGSPLVAPDGEMKFENEVEKKYKFWEYFGRNIISGEPPENPSFNYIKCKANGKIGKLDFLGEFYSFGLILSSKFKHFLESSRLGKHYFYNVVLKHGQHFNYDYYFFCLGEKSFNAIDFSKSYFYFPENSRYAFYRENYLNSLIQFKNYNELVASFGTRKHQPVAFNIEIRKDRILDIIDLSFLSLRQTYYFSEEFVNIIINNKLCPNIEFVPLEHIEYYGQ